MRSTDGARSLDREYYVDESFFRQECEKLFLAHWMMLGRTRDLLPPSPQKGNSLRAIDHFGIPLVLCRDQDQSIRCFHNVCRHRGAVMVNEGLGCAEKGVISCPYHAWKYDCHGRLVGVPNMAEIPDFDRDQHGLLSVQVAEKGGFLFVRIHEQSSTIDEWLRPLLRHFDMWSLDELIMVRQIEYDLNANWKLLFENYNECYHCPIIHPELNRLTPYRTAENDLTAGHILGGPMSLAEGIETMSHNGSRGTDYLPKLDAIERRRVYYFTVFPSCFLSFHPDFVMIHRLQPLAADRTRVYCQFLFHIDASRKLDFVPDGVIEFWDRTNVQDWDVCQRVQAGARSPYYRSGPLSNLESVVAAFDRFYLSELKRLGVNVT